MSHRLFLFLIFIGLFACQSNVREDNSKIEQLKKVAADNPTKENRDAVINAIRAEINTNPNNANQNAQYFHDLANLHIENKSFVMALQTLMQGIQDYPKAKGTDNNVWKMAEIYNQHIQRPAVGTIVGKFYAQRFPGGAQAAVAKKILNENRKDVSADITTLGSNMYDETTHKVDYQAANDYIRVCELYSLLNPQNGQSPDYLHKAGETARAIRAFPKAIAIYDKIYTQYPTYEKASQALFLKAFTYDNDLNDKATAKSLYEEFLQQFPNDDFADDTQFLLKNLGKNDEEIIKEFGEK